MKLFASKPENILPLEGEAYYHGPVFGIAESDRFLETLLQGLEWQNDRALIMGKMIETRRKVAWYADRPFDYTYSGSTKRALPWHALLLQIRERVQLLTGESFNSCLANLYHDGEDGMAYHSDAEAMLKPFGVIASLSFGAQRRFLFKHKRNRQRVTVELEHGSLLCMQGACQRNWLHRLPPMARINEPRVNLTFRQMREFSAQ